MELILASKSPRRKQLLELLGIRFQVKPVDVDESLQGAADPDRAVRSIASAKASAGAKSNPGAFVLGADTLVISPSGMPLGKPVTPGEAADMLMSLSGAVHTVITGVCVVPPKGTGKCIAVRTEVEFKRLAKEEVSWYLSTGEPFDKAGAYGIQGKASALVKSINGSYTNVVGLPLPETIGLLMSMGWNGFPPSGGRG